MDDFENAKVRRLRGLPAATYDDNFIPPEKRGKRKCPDGCDRGGFYDKPAGARCATYRPCKTCNGTGELPL